MDYEKLKAYIDSCDDYNRYNHLRLLSVSEGRCETVVELGHDGMNRSGAAHGGLIFSLADMAAGVTSRSLGRVSVTLDASIQYLRATRSGSLRAVCRAVKAGRTTGFYDIEVFRDDGEVAARVSMTVFYTGAYTTD